jgi:hypothetical protein
MDVADIKRQERIIAVNIPIWTDLI